MATGYAYSRGVLKGRLLVRGRVNRSSWMPCDSSSGEGRVRGGEGTVDSDPPSPDLASVTAPRHFPIDPTPPLDDAMPREGDRER